jgi:hypothetical protein
MRVSEGRDGSELKSAVTVGKREGKGGVKSGVETGLQAAIETTIRKKRVSL